MHTTAFVYSRDGETALCLIYVKPTEAALAIRIGVGAPAAVCGCQAIC